jgi:hypothetical protein
MFLAMMLLQLMLINIINFDDSKIMDDIFLYSVADGMRI